MKRLDDLIESLERLPQQLETVIAEEVLTSEPFKELMVEANIEQLQQGIRSDGTRIDSPPGRPYASSTIARKRRLGQPIDRVTLKDTGNFYALLRVREFPGKLEMWDDDVELLEKLSAQYGDEILGITEANMSPLRDIARSEIEMKTRLFIKNSFSI